MQLTSLSPLLLQALLQHILLRSRNRCLAPQMQNRRFSIHCYPLLFYKVRVRTYVLRIRRTSEEHQYLFGAGWQTLPSGKPQRESCNGKAPTGKLQRESSKHHMPPTCWAHHKKVQPTIQATWMCYNPINTIVHSCSSRAAWAKIAPTGKLQRESSNGRTPTGKLQRESSNGKAPTGKHSHCCFRFEFNLFM